jgi:hypothetical protein
MDGMIITFRVPFATAADPAVWVAAGLLSSVSRWVTWSPIQRVMVVGQYLPDVTAPLSSDTFLFGH